MKNNLLTLDVRQILDLGQEPFALIMTAVASMRAGEQLKLLAPVEPAPLYRVIEDRGLKRRTSVLSDGTWEVHFSPESQSQSLSN